MFIFAVRAAKHSDIGWPSASKYLRRTSFLQSE